MGKKNPTKAEAERSMQSLRDFADDQVNKAVDEALDRAARKRLVTWWVKDPNTKETYAPTRGELKKKLLDTVRDAVSMSQRSGGEYCSVHCGGFMVTAHHGSDGPTTIVFEIASWLGGGFVLTPKALRPSIRKLLKSQPHPH